MAERFGVTKRAVVKNASKEKWTERLSKIQQEAQAASDKKMVEGLEEMRERHLKLLKALGARVVNALREYPLTSGMEAVRAAEALIKLERLAAGQASERTELSVEEVTKREIQELLIRDNGEGDLEPPTR